MLSIVTAAAPIAAATRAALPALRDVINTLVAPRRCNSATANRAVSPRAYDHGGGACERARACLQ